MNALMAIENQDAAPASPENEEHEDLNLGENNFQSFGRKALLLQYVAALGSILYARQVGNESLLSYLFLATLQLWFSILVWATTLPFQDERRCRRQCVFQGLMAIPPISVLVLSPLTSGRNPGEDVAQCDAKCIAVNLAWPIVAIFCIFLILTALRWIRICIRKIYADDHAKLQWVALQCIDDTLRTGIVQIALLTAALVGYGWRTREQIFQSVGNQYYFQNHRNTDLYDWYDRNLSDDDEEVVQGTIMGLQATAAGFAINVFLMQVMLTKHVLKIYLSDVVRGTVTWLEYFSAFLQLVIVASIAALISMTPGDIITGFQVDGFMGRYQGLMIFYIFMPAGILVLMMMYFSWLYARDNDGHGDDSGSGNADTSANSSREFLLKRHGRVSKMEHLLTKAEEERQQLNDSVKEIEAQTFHLVNEIERRASVLESSLEKMKSGSTFLDLESQSSFAFDPDTDELRSSVVAVSVGSLEDSQFQEAQDGLQLTPLEAVMVSKERPGNRSRTHSLVEALRHSIETFDGSRSAYHPPMPAGIDPDIQVPFLDPENIIRCFPYSSFSIF